MLFLESVYVCVFVLVAQSCPTPGTVALQAPLSNTRVDCHALLQSIFLTQGLNLDLPHCRQILYRLSHQGSPRILEWVAYQETGFSRGAYWPRKQTEVSCIAGGFCTSWAYTLIHINTESESHNFHVIKSSQPFKNVKISHSLQAIQNKQRDVWIWPVDQSLPTTSIEYYVLQKAFVCPNVPHLFLRSTYWSR